MNGSGGPGRTGGLRAPGRPSSRGRRPWRSLVGALVLALAACEPPDRPAAAVSPLPEAAVDLLRPDSLRTLRLAPGLAYRYVWSPTGPWALHAVELDARRCELAFVVSGGPGRPEDEAARRRVSELAVASDRRVLAAVNGEFFTAEGRTSGATPTADGPPTPADGAPEAAGPRAAFVWDPAEGPRVVSARSAVSGGGAEASAVVSGFPLLLERGRDVVGDLPRERPSFAGVRHPRTAVGVSGDGSRVWIVVVDGRQGAYSAGMTLPELAELLRALGAEDAVNLDGGGSSAMVLAGKVASRPSDAEGERAVANALLVVREPSGCGATGASAVSFLP